jgi:hypothetical protein
MQEEANLYAAEQINNMEKEGVLKQKSACAQWKHVTLQELKVLCAIIIHMSVLHKSSMHEY